MKRFALLLCCLLPLLAPARPATAQDDSLTAKQLVADTLVRSAIQYVGAAQSVEGDAPYVLAATLLDKAVELDPSNAQAWAMRAELALTAGEPEAYERALVGYLDTGISDDRARFNLIQHRLSHNNTLDEQLGSLEQLLASEAGRALPGPLRSRLAGLAASIAGEMVDESARRKWFVEAARADPANAQAARAILDLVTTLSDDVVRRGSATVNVIRADPLDPLPRLELAALLAEHGAYSRAAQQYQVVSTRLSRQPMPMPAYISWAQCLAMIGEDQTAQRLIDEFEKALNQAPAADAAPQEQPEPAAVPLAMEVIRLATLDGEDEKDAAKAVLDRIATRLNRKPEQGDAEEGSDDPKRQLALIAAVFGPDLDQAQQLIEAGGEMPAAQGWLALRRGDYAKAQQLLEPIAQAKPIAACGLALAVGTDTQGRARLLQSFLNDASASSLAALAAGRALLSMDTAPWPSATGKTLTDLMGKYSESFWQVDLDRTPWLEVRMRIEPQRIDAMQPIIAEVTIWNTTRLPLAIGEGGPIASQAMVQITGSASGRQLPPLPPVVVDLGRRFTLKAGERLTFDTRLDYHAFGALRWDNLGVPLVFDARLIVNPSPMPGGNFLPSGIGGIADVRKSFVQSKPTVADDIDRWLTDLAGDDAPKRLEAMARLAVLDPDAQPDLVRPSLLERLRPAMAGAWDQRDTAEQAWMLANTSRLADAGTSYPELLERAKASPSELIWLVLLSRQVKSSESDLLSAAIGRQDLPDLSRFAERQRKLLREIEKLNEQAPPPAEPGAATEGEGGRDVTDIADLPGLE